MLSLYKLKEDVKTKWNIDVDVTLTTKVDKTIYGFVSIEHNIFVNANKFYTEESILGVIGHEIAHILSTGPEHDEGFTDKLFEVIEFFKSLYGVDVTSVLDKIEVK